MPILRALHEHCKINNANLILVTIPYMKMVKDSEWLQIKRNLKLNEKDRFKPYEAFFDPLKTDGVEIVHLNRTFLELDKKGEEIFDAHHRHWNENGHMEIASILSKLIFKYAKQ